MLINTKKCIGCYACRTACQRQNGLLPDESFIRFEEREIGKYPAVTVEHAPMQCMHGEDAPCAAVCPTGAAHTGPDGIVTVDQGRWHRMPVLHGGLPLPGARAQLGDRRGGQVPLLHGFQLRDGHRDVHLRDGRAHAGVRIFGDLDDPDGELVKEINRRMPSPLAAA